MKQINRLCSKTNYVVITRFCCKAHYVEFMRFLRFLKNIIYRVHIAILATYRVHIARTLQKDIPQGCSWRYDAPLQQAGPFFNFHPITNATPTLNQYIIINATHTMYTTHTEIKQNNHHLTEHTHVPWRPCTLGTSQHQGGEWGSEDWKQVSMSAPESSITFNFHFFEIYCFPQI